MENRPPKNSRDITLIGDYRVVLRRCESGIHIETCLFRKNASKNWSIGPRWRRILDWLNDDERWNPDHQDYPLNNMKRHQILTPRDI